MWSHNHKIEILSIFATVKLTSTTQEASKIQILYKGTVTSRVGANYVGYFNVQSL